MKENNIGIKQSETPNYKQSTIESFLLKKKKPIKVKTTPVSLTSPLPESIINLLKPHNLTRCVDPHDLEDVNWSPTTTLRRCNMKVD